MRSLQHPRLSARIAVNNIERRECAGKGNKQRDESPQDIWYRPTPGHRHDREHVQPVVEQKEFKDIDPDSWTADGLAFNSGNYGIHGVGARIEDEEE